MLQEARKYQFLISDMNFCENEAFFKSSILGFRWKKTINPLKITKNMMCRYYTMILRTKKLTFHASSSQEMSVSNRGHEFLL